jgi:hypothetical protein
MMRFSKSMLLIFLISGISLYSYGTERNLLGNGGAELGQQYWGGLKLTDRDFFSGKYCFELTLKKAKQTVAPWYMVKIDPNKLYTFSGKFKSIGSAPCKVTILLISHDKFMRGFGYYAINVRQGTETILTAPVKAGDSVIKVKGAGTWRAAPYFGVAFGVDDSGKYQNLPSHNLSLAGIKSVTRSGDHWLATLNKPLKKDYPAGCKVRLHRSGPYYKTAISAQNISAEWTDLSFQFKGVRKLFEPVSKGKIKKFWHGTKYIGIKILVKGVPGKSKLLLDDLTLTAK